MSLSVATDASENVKVDLKDGEGSLNSTVDIKVQTCRNPLYERALARQLGSVCKQKLHLDVPGFRNNDVSPFGVSLGRYLQELIL